MPIVTETILTGIRRDGFNVGTHSLIEPRTGRTIYHVDARDARACEVWSVDAPDPYTAAFELAVLLGWEFE